MHVFIDTNIFLNFYHYSKEELDTLNDVFSNHKHGSATVYLTEQVQDEFLRNRENKIKDALKKFNDGNHNPQIPSFMKGYDEYQNIKDLAKKIQKARKSILEKVTKDVDNESLLADKLINSIFENSDLIKVSEKNYASANVRLARGNPPGKKGSLGDSLNWELLLESVPKKNDIHIVSADGDFFSSLNEHKINPFLKNEWEKRKKASVFVYRTLSEFTKEHFDGVAFSFDKDKDALINRLSSSGNFSRTHDLIDKLNSYAYFSTKEIERILDAAVENEQFGWIVTDPDVSEFLRQHAIPKMSDLNNQEQLSILERVIQKQIEREEENA